jgi:hypothetical protein
VGTGWRSFAPRLALARTIGIARDGAMQAHCHDPALEAERLRRLAQELLDRWYPGTSAVVDWTGQTFLLQLSRGGRLAPPIWVSPPLMAEACLAIRHELVRAAWLLAAELEPG